MNFFHNGWPLADVGPPFVSLIEIADGTVMFYRAQTGNQASAGNKYICHYIFFNDANWAGDIKFSYRICILSDLQIDLFSFVQQ